jgi:hypothetical protein
VLTLKASITGEAHLQTRTVIEEQETQDEDKDGLHVAQNLESHCREASYADELAGIYADSHNAGQEDEELQQRKNGKMVVSSSQDMLL